MVHFSFLFILLFSSCSENNKYNELLLDDAEKSIEIIELANNTFLSFAESKLIEYPYPYLKKAHTKLLEDINEINDFTREEMEFNNYLKIVTNMSKKYNIKLSVVNPEKFVFFLKEKLLNLIKLDLIRLKFNILNAYVNKYCNI